ncbi:MAG TPA: GNAT family N-acetyltransferase [Thermoleophilia bacterium]|nr:GNAT family N-acetyltransferase [Thermoleophilia bacterium]
MSPRVVHEAPATGRQWDDAWRSSPWATWFESREWSETWCACSSGQLCPDARLVTFSDGVEAVLAVSRQTLGRGRGVRTIASPQGTYGGWLSGDRLTGAHARLLADRLLDLTPDLYWRLNPYDPLAAALRLPTRPDTTLAVDLRDGFEAAVRRWSRGHRSSAHKAQRAGVAVRRAVTEDDWRAYFDVYLASRERWGVDPYAGYGWPLFAELLRRASPQVELWLAGVDETIVAGALCFSTSWHTVYWHGGALAEYFALRPVTWLMHEMMRDAGERGVAWFDLNPSGGLSGVREFKERFGARVLSCPVVERRSSRTRLLHRRRR